MKCFLATYKITTKLSSLIKIRVQFQFRKFIIRHGLELAKSAVGQLPQFRFLWRKLAAHLTQAVDQSGAATGIVNAHQVHFLKSEVSQNCKSTWHCVLYHDFCFSHHLSKTLVESSHYY